MKKKVLIGLISLLGLFLMLYILLSMTNLTKGIAEHTAKSYFSEYYSDFGEVSEVLCLPAETTHYTFPQRISHYYIVSFWREDDTYVRMEISAYWPFSVRASEVISE